MRPRSIAIAFSSAAALGMALGCITRPAPVPFASGRLVDLTHAFDAATIYWPTERGFELEARSGVTPGGYWYAANTFRTAEHGCTHLDAPHHFFERGETADEIALDKLVGPAVVIDVREACGIDRDHLVDAADLAAHEAAHGRIEDGAIVLLRTGFGAFWPDRERYLGTARRGPEAVAELRFPGLDPEAARWLVAERRIRAVGIDTASIDRGRSTDFLAHRALSAAQVPIFENVAQLEALPARGALVIALPMKIAGGSGGPLRIVAWLPETPPR
jgi:kynurenine formamidase